MTSNPNLTQEKNSIKETKAKKQANPLLSHGRVPGLRPLPHKDGLSLSVRWGWIAGLPPNQYCLSLPPRVDISFLSLCAASFLLSLPEPLDGFPRKGGPPSPSPQLLSGSHLRVLGSYPGGQGSQDWALDKRQHQKQLCCLDNGSCPRHPSTHRGNY